MKHRGAITLLALIHLGMGLSVVLGPHTAREPDYALLFEMMPWWLRGVLWMGFGTAASLLALTRYYRWSWVLLSFMPAERAIGYFWSAIMFIFPGLPGGLSSAIGNTLVWLALLLLIRHIAAWPDLPADGKAARE